MEQKPCICGVKAFLHNVNSKHIAPHLHNSSIVNHTPSLKIKHLSNGMPQTPDIFSLVDAEWKHPKTPMFLHIAARVRGLDIHKHENSEVLCSNRNKCSKEMSVNSRLQKNMENMIIDFIWLNVQVKYLIQTISCHVKWDMSLWKPPKCPPPPPPPPPTSPTPTPNPVHAANLVANSCNTAYGVDVIAHYY